MFRIDGELVPCGLLVGEHESRRGLGLDQTVGSPAESRQLERSTVGIRVGSPASLCGAIGDGGGQCRAGRLLPFDGAGRNRVVRQRDPVVTVLDLQLPFGAGKLLVRVLGAHLVPYHGTGLTVVADDVGLTGSVEFGSAAVLQQYHVHAVDQGDVVGVRGGCLAGRVGDDEVVRPGFHLIRIDITRRHGGLLELVFTRGQTVQTESTCRSVFIRGSRAIAGRAVLDLLVSIDGRVGIAALLQQLPDGSVDFALRLQIDLVPCDGSRYRVIADLRNTRRRLRQVFSIDLNIRESFDRVAGGERIGFRRYVIAFWRFGLRQRERAACKIGEVEFTVGRVLVVTAIILDSQRPSRIGVVAIRQRPARSFITVTVRRVDGLGEIRSRFAV